MRHCIHRLKSAARTGRLKTGHRDETLVMGPPVAYNGIMVPSVSHIREDETPEAKARWFQSLTLAERMDVFCEWTDFLLQMAPHVADIRHAPATARKVQVLTLPFEKR